MAHKEENKIVKVDDEIIESSETETPFWNRIMETVDKAFEKGFDKLSTRNDRQREHEALINNRQILLVLVFFVGLLSMWYTAMFLGKDSVANTVLSIMLAAFGGIGIGNMITPKK